MFEERGRNRTYTRWSGDLMKSCIMKSSMVTLLVLSSLLFLSFPSSSLANEITTNATTYEAHDWVEVTYRFTGSNYNSDCWVGLFAPVGTPQMKTIAKEGHVSTPPFVSTAPIKYILCNQSIVEGGEKQNTGKYVFKMNNYRQDVFFALFDGGLVTPTEVKRSNSIKAKFPNAPMHLRLSLTQNLGEMMVGWTAKEPTASFIEYGYNKNDLSSKGEASYVETYGKEDLCGPPGNGSGWFEPGFSFYAIIPAIAGNENVEKECFYRVGSDASGWTDVHSFTQKSPKNLETPLEQVNILVTADVGATEVDGSHYHWEEPNASSTYRGMHGAAHADLAVHIGDLAYATGYESKWENFMTQIEPLSSSLPYMVGLGNHERDFANTGSVGGNDSGGECGIATRHRFRMPTPDHDSDRFWYSFDISGLVHMVMIDTEIALGPGSDQYAFLESDLKAVNRTKTPWVVTMGHRPMYYGGNGGYHVYGDGVSHFEDLEALFIQNNVDICLWGHVHNLMTTCPVKNGTCVAKGQAPVHVVIGNGGQSLTRYLPSTKVPEWVDYKMSNFGWNELVVSDYGKKLAVNMYNDEDDSLYHSVELFKS